MIFQNPEFFWLFLILPLAGYLLFQKRNRNTILFPAVGLLKKKSIFRYGKWLTWLRRFLFVAIFACFVILLARPQSVLENETQKQEGIDIFLAIDVSESMLAEDLKPSRLEAAKKVITEFLEKVETDRVGIIVFSGKPFTQSPLTFDTGILKEYLQTISTDSIRQSIRGLSGTAIGDALLAATNRFQKSEDRSKVLILLTDGEANIGVDPVVAAQYAKEQDVKIYTIGVGQAGGAPLPTFDSQGNKQYARDRLGRVIMSTFDEKALKDIAKIGNGKYFHAQDNAALRQIFEQISQLEQKEIEVSVVTEYREAFMPFLWGIIILFLMFFLVRFRQVTFP